MAEHLVGYSQLQARFAALEGAPKMRLMAAVVRGELVRSTPKRTGHTGNSWQPSNTTASTATVSGSIVNLWLDQGTGLYGPLHQRITPKAAKALRWATGGASSLRQTGRPRAGRAGAGAGWVFARSVKGMKPRPFIARSLRSASGKLGSEVFVKIWNESA